MNICGFTEDSIIEGVGLRDVIFISGCKHECEGCFSKKTWDFHYGDPFTLEKQKEIISNIINNPLLSGITLCGGDPFYSAKEVVKFIQLLKSYQQNINIWSYTGFTFEEIIKDKNMLELLKYCDVLIDGQFIEDQKDLILKFKGSRNQRIIDVQKSLKEHKIIPYQI